MFIPEILNFQNLEIEIPLEKLQKGLNPDIFKITKS